MVSKYKFCVWLIDSLMRKPLTFLEIQQRWEQSASNDDGAKLFERSFNRYRRHAEKLFEVFIIFDKRIGKYTIANLDDLKENKLLGWILSSYRFGHIASDIRKKSYVKLEAPAPASELLDPILEAIEEKTVLNFDYKSHYKDVKKVNFLPVFVKLCQQRWYVIGMNIKTGQERIYALERIHHLSKYVEFSNQKKNYKHTINPDEYFHHSFGIINEGEPQLISIRAYWPQNAYLKDVPLHSSQELLLDTEDYSDFELYLRPTYDFIQALLAQREKVVVLEPSSLKTEIKAVIKAMLREYEAC